MAVAGNHDLILDPEYVARRPESQLDKPGKSLKDLNWGDIIYLQDNTIEIEVRGSRVKVFGSPWVPRCGDFAFQYEPVVDVWKDRIPNNTDIVIVHGPPAGHLDGGKGCASLLKEIWRIRPALVVFGHIHRARGVEKTVARPSQKGYDEIVAGIPSSYGVLSLLWLVIKERIQSPKEVKEITFVNAACFKGEAGTVVTL